MERYFSAGQSPQRAVAPTEEEEDYSKIKSSPSNLYLKNSSIFFGRQ
jgi:hypothetical protein